MRGEYVLENGPRFGSRSEEVPLDVSEDELLESCRRGDVAAFERLYEMHGTRMKSIARNLLGHETDAEDAVQETFLKVYRGAASFRAAGSTSSRVGERRARAALLTAAADPI